MDSEQKALWQKWFDKVIVDLSAQGRQAYVNHACIYIHPTNDNINCAAGKILRDYPELFAFARSYNGVSIRTLLGEADLISIPVPPELKDSSNLIFLTELQRAHDRLANESPNIWFDSFIETMKAVATKYDLNTASIDVNVNTVGGFTSAGFND